MAEKKHYIYYTDGTTITKEKLEKIQNDYKKKHPDNQKKITKLKDSLSSHNSLKSSKPENINTTIKKF